MTELLTPEQVRAIKRQQRAWDSEFRIRGDVPKLALQDFCAMHANVTRLLRDREAICERHVKLATEYRALEAKLAKVRVLRDEVNSFMRSPQKKDHKERAWELGNCINNIKNDLSAILENQS